MKLEMTFQEINSQIDVNFKEVQEVNDGGFEQGYEVGKQDGFKEGYLEGQEQGALKFGIINEVTGKNVVTLDCVNENEHDIEVKLSSDTVTDFSDCKVIVQSSNFFDISKFVSSKNRTNNGDGTITLKAYGVDVVNKLSECCPNIKVGQTIKISGKNLALVYFGNSAISVTNLITVTQEMLDKDWFDFYGSKDGEITISDIMINDGTIAKPYEPHFEENHKANTDGTVDGIKSFPPTMNLICDDVDISAKYFQNPNDFVCKSL